MGVLAEPQDTVARANTVADQHASEAASTLEQFGVADAPAGMDDGGTLGKAVPVLTEQPIESRQCRIHRVVPAFPPSDFGAQSFSAG